MEYRIVPIKQEMHEEIFKMIKAEGWTSIAELVRILWTTNPQTSLCAVDYDGNLLGHILAPRISDNITMIGMILVREGVRRQGICSALMATLQKQLPNTCNIGLDSLPHLKGMYAYFGISCHAHDTINVTGMLDKSALDEIHAPNNKYEIVDFNNVDYNELEEYDTVLGNGNARPKVLKPWLQSFKTHTLVATKCGKIVGYVTLYTHDQYYKIAPLYGDNLEIILLLFISMLMTRVPDGSRVIMQIPTNQIQLLEIAETVELKTGIVQSRLFKKNIAPLNLGKIGAFMSCSGTFC